MRQGFDYQIDASHHGALAINRNYDVTLCRQYDLRFDNNGEELAISLILTSSTCSRNARVVSVWNSNPTEEMS
jgi:hypothetical protein